MLILSIDTATPVAGVALVDDKKVYYEAVANTGYKHSRTLLEMIDVSFRQTGYSLDDVDAIAVTTGPGSFTGLRIGLATAKGLALARSKPLIGIPTLDAIAHNVSWRPDLICPILNARKGEVYAAFYQGGTYSARRLTDYLALSPDNLIKMAHQLMEETGCRSVTVLGDGVNEYRPVLIDSLGEALISPPEYWLPRVSAVGNLAVGRWLSGQLDDLFSLIPTYVRQSEAEIKRARAEGEGRCGTENQKDGTQGR